MQPRSLSTVQQSYLQRLWQARRTDPARRAESQTMRLSSAGADVIVRLDESLTRFLVALDLP